jgi:fluoride ion exporter CrcB/FEX
MSKTTIQLNNDTAANWTSANPVLALGEMGIETDTNKIKFGDGTTAWNTLSYFAGVPASFKYGLYTLSAAQTANLTNNNHVQFDTTSGSLGGLSTGSGQENGIISLVGGQSYKITFKVSCNFSGSTGVVTFSLYDHDTNVRLDGNGAATCYPQSSSANGSYVPNAFWIISPSSNINIDIRLYSPVALTSISYSATRLLIEEYAGV